MNLRLRWAKTKDNIQVAFHIFCLGELNKPLSDQLQGANFGLGFVKVVHFE